MSKLDQLLGAKSKKRLSEMVIHSPPATRREIPTTTTTITSSVSPIIVSAISETANTLSTVTTVDSVVSSGAENLIAGAGVGAGAASQNPGTSVALTVTPAIIQPIMTTSIKKGEETPTDEKTTLDMLKEELGMKEKIKELQYEATRQAWVTALTGDNAQFKTAKARAHEMDRRTKALAHTSHALNVAVATAESSISEIKTGKTDRGFMEFLFKKIETAFDTLAKKRAWCEAVLKPEELEEFNIRNYGGKSFLDMKVDLINKLKAKVEFELERLGNPWDSEPNRGENDYPEIENTYPLAQDTLNLGARKKDSYIERTAAGLDQGSYGNQDEQRQQRRAADLRRQEEEERRKRDDEIQRQRDEVDKERREYENNKKQADENRKRRENDERKREEDDYRRRREEEEETSSIATRHSDVNFIGNRHLLKASYDVTKHCPMVFNGEISEWLGFLDTWSDCMADMRVLGFTNKEIFLKLKTRLRGNALTAVEGDIRPTQESLNEALERLNSLYTNKQINVRNVADKILNLPKMEDTVQSLERGWAVLRKLFQQLITFTGKQDEDKEVFVVIFTSICAPKLSDLADNEWQKIKRRPENANGFSNITIEDFFRCIEIALSICREREANQLSLNPKKKSHDHNYKKQSVLSSSTGASNIGNPAASNYAHTGGRGPPPNAKAKKTCPFCKQNPKKCWRPEKCQKLKGMTQFEIRKIVVDKKLCFRCLSDTHSLKNCNSKGCTLENCTAPGSHSKWLHNPNYVEKGGRKEAQSSTNQANK